MLIVKTIAAFLAAAPVSILSIESFVRVPRSPKSLAYIKEG